MAPMNLGLGLGISRLGIGGNSMSQLFTLTVVGNTLMASGLGITLTGNDVEAI